VSSWSTPWCRSRSGASHRRRGDGGQDCSGWQWCRDADGQPIALMAVADGHGGARYSHSAVGSWLACQVALNTLTNVFRRSHSQASLEQWQHQLAQEIPRELHRHWLQAVARHQGPLGEAGGPIPYGTTLGLVVMTPRWWAHTGLGDWDLVQLQEDGQASLLSEESSTAAPGEATFSLCLPEAAGCFVSRTAVHPIHPEDAPFALLLSTDGIRKSCSTDADFLTLAAYLGQLPPPATSSSPDLDQALDRISSQGSGDDVSLAVARWTTTPGATQPRQSRAGSRPHLDPSTLPSLAAAASPPAPSASQDQAHPQGPLARPARPRLPILGLGAGLTLLLLALVLTRWLGRPLLETNHNHAPTTAPALPEAAGPPQQASLPRQQRVRQLCAKPAAPLQAELLNRAAVFDALLQGTPSDSVLRGRQNDADSGLIVRSFDPGSRGPIPEPALQSLTGCDALAEALAKIWQQRQTLLRQRGLAASPP